MSAIVKAAQAEMRGYLNAQRRIVIDGELNFESLAEPTKEVVKLDFESREPITILLSSNGGIYDATLQFCDIMAALNSPVDAVVIGDCCSMAVDLLQMCRKRSLLPSSRILVHYTRYKKEWIGDDIDLLEGDITFFRQSMRQHRERRFDLYARRTGLSHEKLAEMFRHGEMHRAYFSAEQAVEMKLADEIIYDFKFFKDKKYDNE